MTRDHFSKTQYNPYFQSDRYQESEEHKNEVCIETWFVNATTKIKSFFKFPRFRRHR